MAGGEEARAPLVVGRETVGSQDTSGANWPDVQRLVTILLSPAEAGSCLLLACTQPLRARLMTSAATRLGITATRLEITYHAAGNLRATAGWEFAHQPACSPRALFTTRLVQHADGFYTRHDRRLGIYPCHNTRLEICAHATPTKRAIATVTSFPISGFCRIS